MDNNNDFLVANRERERDVEIKLLIKPNNNDV